MPGTGNGEGIEVFVVGKTCVWDGNLRPGGATDAKQCNQGKSVVHLIAKGTSPRTEMQCEAPRAG